MQFVPPILGWWYPIGQFLQLETAVVAKRPNVHCVQALAPVSAPAFVMDPAAQFVHDETADDVEYFPASHSTHERAAEALPVFVVEPALHSKQSHRPLKAWYVPGVHAVQFVFPV